MIIGVLRWGWVEVILWVSLEVILHNLLRHRQAVPTLGGPCDPLSRLGGPPQRAPPSSRGPVDTPGSIPCAVSPPLPINVGAINGCSGCIEAWQHQPVVSFNYQPINL